MRARPSGRTRKVRHCRIGRDPLSQQRRPRHRRRTERGTATRRLAQRSRLSNRPEPVPRIDHVSRIGLRAVSRAIDTPFDPTPAIQCQNARDLQWTPDALRCPRTVPVVLNDELSRAAASSERDAIRDSGSRWRCGATREQHQVSPDAIHVLHHVRRYLGGVEREARRRPWSRPRSTTQAHRLRGRHQQPKRRPSNGRLDYRPRGPAVRHFRSRQHKPVTKTSKRRVSSASAPLGASLRRGKTTVGSYEAPRKRTAIFTRHRAVHAQRRDHAGRARLFGQPRPNHDPTH
jgi:hypothetical protein